MNEPHTCDELRAWYDHNPGDSNKKIANSFHKECDEFPPPVKSGELKKEEVSKKAEQKLSKMAKCNARDSPRKDVFLRFVFADDQKPYADKVDDQWVWNPGVKKCQRYSETMLAASPKEPVIAPKLGSSAKIQRIGSKWYLHRHLKS